MAPVGAQLAADDAGRSERAVARRRLQHDRAGAVAEQHAGRAVAPVEQARERLGADHQRALVRTGDEELVGRRDREDEAGAHRLQIEGDAVRHAEIGLHLGRHRRKGVVRRRGRDDDEIDVGGAEPGIGQRRLGGLAGERRGGLALGGDVALANAGALGDPLVGGVDHRRHFGVADHALRQARADAAHD